MILEHNELLKGWLMTLWYRQYFGSFTFPTSLGHFDEGNSITHFSSKSSNIRDKSELGNGYFFAWNLWCFFLASLVDKRCFSSTLGFPEIRIGLPVETDMDFLIELWEDWELFLKSPFFFLLLEAEKLHHEN